MSGYTKVYEYFVGYKSVKRPLVFFCFLEHIRKIIDHFVKLLGAQAKPCDTLCCLGVYLAHHWHLNILLGDVALVNTHSVDPDRRVLLRPQNILKYGLDIGSNFKRKSITDELLIWDLALPTV